MRNALIDEAVPQYEEAIALMTDERQQQGFKLLVSSMKTNLEGYEFVKSQMQLVTDESIVDAKTFEERFLSLGRSSVGHSESVMRNSPKASECWECEKRR